MPRRLLRRAVDAGYRTRSGAAQRIPVGPNTGAMAAYLIDPDGYHIELFQRPVVQRLTRRPSKGIPTMTTLTGLPLLPVQSIGSSGVPSWVWLVRDAVAEGKLGPSDIDESLKDAAELALLDMTEAGYDIVSDGEMLRADFTRNFHGRIDGLEPIDYERRLGYPGPDQLDAFSAVRAGERARRIRARGRGGAPAGAHEAAVRDRAPGPGDPGVPDRPLPRVSRQGQARLGARALHQRRAQGSRGRRRDAHPAR